MVNEKRLTETITEGGIPWINFFNGRLLSGEDLRAEQDSNLKGRRRLGLAIGEGVVQGLEVTLPNGGVNTRETPSVVVGGGLAINRQGQTLWLENQTNVKLTRPLNADSSVAGDVAFVDCQPLQPGVYVAEAGVYLLTIAPAKKNEGRAAVSGLDNIIARCNTHHAVESVQFRLIQLGLNAEELNDPDHLRNIIAYKCFGIDNTRSPIDSSVDPFNPSSRQTLLDDLRPRLLTDCDVPLAIIHWTSTEGIKFVDMWSVRRRVFAPGAAGGWSAVLGERRQSEVEAMFLQFQDHLQALRDSEDNPDTITATKRFRYLPPVGVLPLKTGNARGVQVNAFFEGVAHRNQEFIDGAQFGALVRDGLNYEPIDLSNGEMVWLYRVWQNEKAVTDGTSRQSSVVFVGAHVPFVATARFDVGRWSYSKYASAASCGVGLSKS
ncbi:MAG: hypothetical protein QOH41_2238 [Blastocatellia bacterium]|jgi:hypothetical protein|nr:hypothetical protein [Blastocatellia bacterium]